MFLLPFDYLTSWSFLAIFLLLSSVPAILSSSYFDASLSYFHICVLTFAQESPTAFICPFSNFVYPPPVSSPLFISFNLVYLSCVCMRTDACVHMCMVCHSVFFHSSSFPVIFLVFYAHSFFSHIQTISIYSFLLPI